LHNNYITSYNHNRCRIKTLEKRELVGRDMTKRPHNGERERERKKDGERASEDDA